MRKRILGITFFVLCAAITSVAQSPETLITLSAKNQPLREVLKNIQSQTGLNLMISEKNLAGAKKITINVKNKPLKQVLDLCFKDSDLEYSIVDGTIAVKKREPKLSFSNSPANDSSMILIQGRVTTRERQPLAGATIHLSENKTTGITDPEGRYSIFAQKRDQIVFSYVNYKQEVVSVKGRTRIDVVMEASINAMEEVTVSTGYQRIQQKSLTGSVTSLKMDSINQPGLTTVDKMLEGRVPGMIYMQNSGQPGAAPKLRIRGTSTLLGTQEPLWVIDGIAQTDPVPIPASKINDLDFVNLVGNAVSGLNPNDIEQIDVLKDAAATALYGVRAANGVIVVTTKRGKPGPPALNYVVSGNYTRRPRYTDNGVYMMNSAERVDVSREIINKQLGTISGELYDGYEKAVYDYYNGDINYDTYREKVNRAETMNTDWFKILTRDIFSTNHTLSLSGGNTLSRYYASLGYTNELGVVQTEYNKRYTGQIKYDINYKNFKAQFDISVNQGKRHYVPGEIGALNYAYGTSRAVPLYNEDGSLYYYKPASFASSNMATPAFGRFNILNEIDHSGNDIEENTYRATANLNYQVLPGLQAEAVFSYYAGNTSQDTWFDEQTNWVASQKGTYGPYPDGSPNIMDPIPFGGQLNQQKTQKKMYTIRGQLNYSRFLDGSKKHLVNLLAGSELSSAASDNIAQRRRGYYPERGYSFAYIDPGTYSAYAQWSANLYQNDGGNPLIDKNLANLVSGYVTGTYIYNDRYAISASTRSDFSNAFGSRSNEKFLPTWSLSGRWNMQNDVFRNSRWIDRAALLLSYGTQGNMLPYQTPYTIIEKGTLNSLYNAFGSTIVALPNPNLKWERTDSYNAALEFSLFNNRINGSVGYFYKKTSDAFLTKTVSTMNGVSQFTVNSGILENKGMELQFNFVPVNNLSVGRNRKGFIWRIDPQLSQVLNTLLSKSLNRKENTIIDPSLLLSAESLLSGAIPVNGRPVNTFYSYRFKGLDNKGVPSFYGLEPDQQEALAEKYSAMQPQDVYLMVMTESGRREPTIQGSVSNYFGYNNWALDVTFTYSLGNKIRLLKMASGSYGAIRPLMQQNLRKEFVDRWQNPGDENKTNIPGISSWQGDPGDMIPWWFNYNTNANFGSSYYDVYDNSDLRVVSGNYLKLQSVSLRYNLSPGLCSQWRIKAATLGFGGSNLFTFAAKELRGQDPTQSGTSPNINLSVRPVYNFFVNLSL